MDWLRLTNNECPKCGMPLQLDQYDRYICEEEECGFKISQERMDRILADMG